MSKKLGILTVAALGAAIAMPITGSAAAGSTVVTTTGTFQSVPSLTDNLTNMFMGIRYAAPPIGKLRWAPPQAPTPASGTVVASQPGNACPQPIDTTPITQSEDCLFLNVYVPASTKADAALPVYYFLHGGGTIGTGAWYDPSVMVAENHVIVVTINYRLGALGWLATSGLAATTANKFQNVGDSGDYNLMDQLFALQWIQANIGKFGGDPHKVTIGGESDGGISVTDLLTSPVAGTDLFRGAIIETGWFMDAPTPTQSDYIANVGIPFSKALGCTPPADADCLRSQSVDAILNAESMSVGLGLAFDSGTRILPRNPWAAISAGEFARVPILAGTNANESRYFEPSDMSALVPDLDSSTAAAAGGPANWLRSNVNELCATSSGTAMVCSYPQEIDLYLSSLDLMPQSAITPNFVRLLTAEYPLANFPDSFLPNNAPSSDEGLAQIHTDLEIACLSSNIESQLAKHTSLFAYEFHDPQAPPLDAYYIEAPNDEYGYPTASEHGAEIQFLFAWTTIPLNMGENKLAEEMKTYWANFITSGNPNVGRFADQERNAGDERREGHWLRFNEGGAMQKLVPGPQSPHPFFSFREEHFCNTWQPFLAVK